MHLKMNGYPDSFCYQNTALSCVMCSATYLVRVGSTCLKRRMDGCMPETVYWYRLMTCSKCMDKIQSSSIPIFNIGVIGTSMITNSPAFKHVAKYLGVIPRVYSIGDMHIVQNLAIIKDFISEEAQIEYVSVDQTISVDKCSIKDV
jgi:hypothetical protein